MFETITKGQNLSSLPWYDIFMPWPGFEPGLLRPQRKVLTTIRSRLNWGHVELDTTLHFNTCIGRLKSANFTPHLWQYHEAVVAEWLRRLTRNQIPSGSVGSNPTDCARFFGIIFLCPRAKRSRFHEQSHSAVVAEWLRRLTRNQSPSGSVGSSPTNCEINLLFPRADKRDCCNFVLQDWIDSMSSLCHWP